MSEKREAGSAPGCVEDFRTLPPRILPDDHVALVETRSSESRPWPAPSEAQVGAQYNAGG